MQIYCDYCGINTAIKTNSESKHECYNMAMHGNCNGLSRNVPIKAEDKPGRNEPCSCGSGLKFKKCCLK